MDIYGVPDGNVRCSPWICAVFLMGTCGAPDGNVQCS